MSIRTHSALTLFLAIFIIGLSGRLAAQDSVAVQLNQTHSGASSVSGTMPAALTKAWSVNLGGQPSYPLIADGQVFAVANGQLYGLNPANGSVNWDASIGGWGATAYDAGRVFVVNGGGVLEAFDATSGTQLWSAELPGQYSFSSAPTGSNGIVYVAGAGDGGTLYAVAEASGELLWTQEVANGDDSAPAVTGSGVYVTYPAAQDYDFDPISGNLIWHYPANGDGGGGATSVYYDNQLYTEDWAGSNLILNGSTGALIGLNPSDVDHTPIFYGSQCFSMNGGTLRASNLTGGDVQWSEAGDGGLATSPIYLNGHVYEGSSKGTLFSFNPATGQTEWSGSMGDTAAAGDGEDMAAGDGMLIVPGSTNLIAYTYSVTAAPYVVTGTSTAGSVSAILNAGVDPEGSAASAYFQYGTDTTYGSATASSSVGSGMWTLVYSSTVAGLLPRTTYHYRVVAVNTSGTSYGADETFVASGAFAAVTGSVASVTSTSAVLYGTVETNGTSATAWFDYAALSGSASIATASQALGSGTAPVAYNATVKGLTPSTTYEYWAVASDAGGSTTGTYGYFTTLASPPTAIVVTGSAVSVTSGSAVLEATVNPNGLPASAWFSYQSGTGPAIMTTSTPMGSGTVPVNLQAPIIGLSPGTTYTFRVIASDTNGNSTGAYSTFTTDTEAPTAITGTVSSVTDDEAIISGFVNDNGLATTGSFQFGTDTTYGGGTAVFQLPAGTGNTLKTSTLVSLLPETTYHYRIVATNSLGTVTGSDATFTTGEPSPVAVSVTAYTIKGQGVIIPVLANDYGGNTAGYSLLSVTQGAYGQVFINPNHTLSYVPGLNFRGGDQFTYTMTDGNAVTTGTVTIGNLFTSAEGAYNGLVGTSGTVPAGWGAITVQLNSAGSLTGLLKIADSALHFAGKLRYDGEFSAVLSGAPGVVTTVYFQADPANKQLTGGVVSGTNTAAFTAPLIPFGPTNLTTDAGRYVLLLTGSQASPGQQTIPQGVGVASMVVQSNGAVSVTGWMGDGAPFTASAFERADRSVPLYATAKTGPRMECLFGTLNFAPVSGQNDCSGLLDWSSGQVANPNLPYAPGFSASAVAVGSRYTVTRNTPVLNFANSTGNALVTFGPAGSGPAPASATITLKSNNSFAGPAKFKLSLDVATGLFSGSAAGPASPVSFHGGIFQIQNLGAGWFMENGFTGSVSLEAAP